MCGEKRDFVFAGKFLVGSPPRVRGKEDINSVEHATHGITPACAGKRTGFPSLCKLWGDHPRVCGEKVRPLLIVQSSAGSPPRVRGKVHTAFQIVNGARITPACAGKSAYIKGGKS